MEYRDSIFKYSELPVGQEAISLEKYPIVAQFYDFAHFSRQYINKSAVFSSIEECSSLGVACDGSTTRFSSFLFGLERRSRLPQLVVVDFSFVVELNQSEETDKRLSIFSVSMSPFSAKISTCGLNGPLNPRTRTNDPFQTKFYIPSDIRHF